MTIRLEAKRPAEVRTYRHDWTPFLGDDTISSQTTTIAGATLDSATVEAGNQSVLFKISGGTENVPARLEHSIVTASGLTEAETFILPITGAEVVTLGQAKAYLRVRTDSENDKICAMIPRARRWVEDYTGLILVKRQFVERLLPTFGIIRLSHGPLVSIDAVDYIDSSGAAATLTPTAHPPRAELFVADGWPGLADNEAFEITYTAGFEIENIDDRLTGAMLALIEGEFAEGYAYPERATDAAARCCAYLKQMVA